MLGENRKALINHQLSQQTLRLVQPSKVHPAMKVLIPIYPRLIPIPLCPGLVPTPNCLRLVPIPGCLSLVPILKVVVQ